MSKFVVKTDEYSIPIARIQSDGRVFLSNISTFEGTETLQDFVQSLITENVQLKERNAELQRLLGRCIGVENK